MTDTHSPSIHQARDARNEGNHDNQARIPSALVHLGVRFGLLRLDEISFDGLTPTMDADRARDVTQQLELLCDYKKLL